MLFQRVWKDMSRNVDVVEEIVCKLSASCTMHIMIGREMITSSSPTMTTPRIERMRICTHSTVFSTIVKNHSSVAVKCNSISSVKISTNANAKRCVITAEKD